MKVDFSKLVGETANLYYCNELNKFQLGGVIFEVFESEEDNRTYMTDIGFTYANITTQKLAEVIIIESNHVDGYELIDKDNAFCWLMFGTSYDDTAYPCFIFQVSARPPIEDKLKLLIKT